MLIADLRKRIINGFFSGFVNNIITVLIQLLGIPILISNWGINYYGEWLVLSAIPSYIALSEIGLGTVVNTKINVLVLENKEKEASIIFNQAFNFMLKLGLFPLLIFVLFIILPNSNEKLNIHYISELEYRIAALFLGLYSFLALLLSLPTGLYRAINYYAKGQHINNIFKILEFTSLLSSVLFGAKVIEASFILFIIRFVQSLYIYYDLKKITTIINVHLSKINFKIIQPLLKPSFSLLGIYAGNSLINQGMIIITNISLGSNYVAILTTVRTLGNTVIGVVRVVNQTFFGEFTTAYFQRNFILTKKLLKTSEIILISLCLLIIVFLFFAGDTIIRLWTSNRIQITQPFFNIFLISLLLNSVWYSRWNFLLAINKHIKIFIPYLLTAMFALTIAYVFIPNYGLWIIAISLLLIDVILIPLVFYLTEKAFSF